MNAYLVSYDFQTSEGTERRSVELYGATIQEALKTFHHPKSAIRGLRLTERTPSRPFQTQAQLRKERNA